MRPILYSTDLVTTRKRLEAFWGIPLDVPSDLLRFRPTAPDYFQLMIWIDIAPNGTWIPFSPELFEKADLPTELQ